jgi:hypothetical protein
MTDSVKLATRRLVSGMGNPRSSTTQGNSPVGAGRPGRNVEQDAASNEAKKAGAEVDYLVLERML